MTPTAKVPPKKSFRAEALDPLMTTSLIADMTVVEAWSSKKKVVQTGMTPGTYYYAVSATYPYSDDNNPGGESLPGEILTVFVPATSSSVLIQVKLTWNPIPEATRY